MGRITLQLSDTLRKNGYARKSGKIKLSVCCQFSLISLQLTPAAQCLCNLETDVTIYRGKVETVFKVCLSHDSFQQVSGRAKTKARLAITLFLSIQICASHGWPCKCSSVYLLWVEIMTACLGSRQNSPPIPPPDESRDKSLKEKKKRLVGQVLCTLLSEWLSLS